MKLMILLADLAAQNLYSMVDLPLSAEGVNVGREGCALTLKDPLISRKHAVIWYEEGNVYIQDLSSRNGTFVNGARVTKARLTTGLTIRLGKSILTIAKVDAQLSGASL